MLRDDETTQMEQFPLFVSLSVITQWLWQHRELREAERGDGDNGGGSSAVLSVDVHCEYRRLTKFIFCDFLQIKIYREPLYSSFL